MEVTPGGYRAYEEWIANDDVQRAKDAFDRLIESQFGTTAVPKDHPFTRVSQGLIGIAVNDRAQELVVVVDPRLVDIDTLNTTFQNLAEKTPTQLTYRAQASCFSAEKLIEAGKVIRARDWHPAASTTAYGGWLDPHTSTHHYTFSPDDRAVGEALKERLGNLVTIDYGEVATRLNRHDDSEPHWGGAGIGRDIPGQVTPNICTSGFAVDTQSNGKAMVTAGHCFNNGQQVESNDEYYGQAQGESLFPIYDMILINHPAQNYDDDLYMDPILGANSPLDVDAAENAEYGDYICISGMVSGASCGNRVYSAKGEKLCDSQGCTLALVGTYNSSEIGCRPGDSGSPMLGWYSDVTIAGLLIGGTGHICKGERVSAVEGHLNVSVATSP